jgi:hypothetical protein
VCYLLITILTYKTLKQKSKPLHFQEMYELGQIYFDRNIVNIIIHVYFYTLTGRGTFELQMSKKFTWRKRTTPKEEKEEV